AQLRDGRGGGGLRGARRAGRDRRAARAGPHRGDRGGDRSRRTGAHAVLELGARRALRVRISLTRLDPTGADRSALVGFMTRNEFPFHVRSRAADIDGLIDKGAYRDEDNDSFWI